MDWNKILEQVLLIVLPPLCVWLLGLLTAQVTLAWKKFEANKPEMADFLYEAVGMAIHAAEQAGLNGWITDKKAYALQVAEDYLKVRGVTVDLHILDNAIEAEVNRTFPHDAQTVETIE